MTNCMHHIDLSEMSKINFVQVRVVAPRRETVKTMKMQQRFVSCDSPSGTMLGGRVVEVESQLVSLDCARAGIVAWKITHILFHILHVSSMDFLVPSMSLLDDEIGGSRDGYRHASTTGMYPISIEKRPFACDNSSDASPSTASAVASLMCIPEGKSHTHHGDSSPRTLADAIPLLEKKITVLPELNGVLHIC